MATAPTEPVRTAIPVPLERIVEFCRKWELTEFALFGSILRDDFRPESDVDVLVDYRKGWPHTLFDWVLMQDELQAIFGRRVDLIARRGIERSRNPWRRGRILGSARTVYAA